MIQDEEAEFIINNRAPHKYSEASNYAISLVSELLEEEGFHYWMTTES